MDSHIHEPFQTLDFLIGALDCSNIVRFSAVGQVVNFGIQRFIRDFRESEAEDGIQSKRGPGWSRFICPRPSHLLGLSQKLILVANPFDLS
jgi:hypothetical protein